MLSGSRFALLLDLSDTESTGDSESSVEVFSDTEPTGDSESSVEPTETPFIRCGTQIAMEELFAMIDTMGHDLPSENIPEAQLMLEKKMLRVMRDYAVRNAKLTHEWKLEVSASYRKEFSNGIEISDFEEEKIHVREIMFMEEVRDHFLHSARYSDSLCVDAMDIYQLMRAAEGKEEATCSICMDRFSNTEILPCKHAEFCHPCISKVKEARKPCPWCRGAIGEISIRVNPMRRFQFLRSAEKGEATCSICNDRVARATIEPCKDMGFCYPCIFRLKIDEQPCPCCQGPIERVQFDDFHPIKDLFGVMSIDDWSSMANEDAETLADYAEFWGESSQNIAANFFYRWAF